MIITKCQNKVAMTSSQYAAVEKRFLLYVDGFRGSGGILPPMQELKWRHTAGVVADAAVIMAAEGWDEKMTTLGKTAALLHDAGRFSQFREFGTFQDHASVNHAERGCEVIAAAGLLNGVGGYEAQLVLEAVRLHNVKQLPPLDDARLAMLALLVRDADKLDIFRVFEDAVAQDHFASNPEIAWNMSMEGCVSEAVIHSLEQGRPVDHRDIATFYDFVMSQVSWLDGQLHYRESRRLARTRDALAFRERLVLAHCADGRLPAVFRRIRERM